MSFREPATDIFSKQIAKQVYDDMPTLRRENSWEFFINPKSDYEDRQKKALENYRKEVQQEMKEYYAAKDRERKSKLVEKTPEKPLKSQLKPSPRIQKQGSSAVSPERHRPIEDQVVISPMPIEKPKEELERTVKLIPKGEDPMQETIWRANMSFEEHVEVREKQREEWKKSLLEQIESKRQLEASQKSRKLHEDKMEIAKINRQLKELEVKYSKEIKREQGFEDSSDTSRKTQPQIYEETKTQDKDEPRFKKKPVQNIFSKNYFDNQMKTLSSLITDIQEESYSASVERKRVLNEIELLKNNRDDSRTIDIFATPMKTGFKPNYFQYERKYKPPTGYSTFSAREYQTLEYPDIEGIDARNHLTKLDHLLNFTATSHWPDHNDYMNPPDDLEF